jgi:hypothetical protein
MEEYGEEEKEEKEDEEEEEKGKEEEKDKEEEEEKNKKKKKKKEEEEEETYLSSAPFITYSLPNLCFHMLSIYLNSSLYQLKSYDFCCIGLQK